jgi:hypothetical protein
MRIKTKLTRKIASIIAAIAIFAGITTLAAPAAFAVISTGHAYGHTWSGDGTSYLGSYQFADGSVGYCMDVTAGVPISFNYTVGQTNSFQREDGAFLSDADLARLNYIMTQYGASTNPDVAAAVQLNVWRITGMNGHTDGYYAARANGSAAAVIAEADNQVAAANTNASLTAGTGADAQFAFTNVDGSVRYHSELPQRVNCSCP